MLLERPGDAAVLAEHPDFARAVPTDEHFLPLLYLAGFAAETGQAVHLPVTGYAYGSLSMTCASAGLPCPPRARGLPGAAPLSDVLPPEASNI